VRDKPDSEPFLYQGAYRYQLGYLEKGYSVCDVTTYNATLSSKGKNYCVGNIRGIVFSMN
jgi:hypothetical protein